MNWPEILQSNKPNYSVKEPEPIQGEMVEIVSLKPGSKFYILNTEMTLIGINTDHNGTQYAYYRKPCDWKLREYNLKRKVRVK